MTTKRAGNDKSKRQYGQVKMEVTSKGGGKYKGKRQYGPYAREVNT